jgi:hypothetical protein
MADSTESMQTSRIMETDFRNLTPQLCALAIVRAQGVVPAESYQSIRRIAIAAGSQSFGRAADERLAPEHTIS